MKNWEALSVCVYLDSLALCSGAESEEFESLKMSHASPTLFFILPCGAVLYPGKGRTKRQEVLNPESHVDLSLPWQSWTAHLHAFLAREINLNFKWP